MISSNIPKYIPPHKIAPFPQRLVKAKADKRFDNLMVHLRKFYLNIPFTDVITQIPIYNKFLKEILAYKRKITEDETVSLMHNITLYSLIDYPQNTKIPVVLQYLIQLGIPNLNVACVT